MTDKKLLLSKATEPKTVSAVRGGANVDSVSITNNVNGNRIRISDSLYEKLGRPHNMKFAVVEDEKILIIGENILNVSKSYKVSDKKSGIVYNAALVHSVSEAMELDFSDKTSVTSRDVELELCDGVNTAFVQF